MNIWSLFSFIAALLLDRIVSGLRINKKQYANILLLCIFVLILAVVGYNVYTGLEAYELPSSEEEIESQKIALSVVKDAFYASSVYGIVLCFFAGIGLWLLLRYYDLDRISEKKLTEEINKFTESISENCSLLIAGGDLSAFGDVCGFAEESSKNKNNEIIGLTSILNKKKYISNNCIHTNSEYSTLLSIRTKVREIRILCSSINIPEEIKHTYKRLFRDDTYTNESVENFYNDMMKNKLNVLLFKQMLRYGKIIFDFQGNVKIAFNDGKINYIKSKGRIITNQEDVEKVIIYDSEKTGINKMIYRFRKLEPKSYDSNLHKRYFNTTWDLAIANSKTNEKYSEICKRLYMFHKEKIYSCQIYDNDSINNEKKAESNYQDMKIALVYCEAYEISRLGKKRKEMPPFGVMYLAAALEHYNISVDVIAISNNDKENGNDYIKDFSKYDVVGFSMVASYSHSTFYNCIRNSTFKDNKILIAGGLHSNIMHEEILLEFDIDYVFKGEAEISLVKFIQCIPKKNMEKVKGLWYKDKNNNILFSGEGRIIEDLDGFIIPSRSKLKKENIVMNNRLAGTRLKMTHIIFSRGCNYGCKYCAAAQHPVRYRSPADIRNELVTLIEEYGIKGFAVVDDNFLYNQEKVIDICNQIKDLGLKWSAVSRVDNINNKIVKIMKEAGCIELKFGIETGSQKILDTIGKGTKIAQAENAIKAAKRNDIRVKCFIVHGFPGENTETTEETIQFLEKMGKYIDRVSLLRFVPLPGSYIYNHPEEFGISRKNLEQTAFAEYNLYKSDHNWWGSSEQNRIRLSEYKRLKEFMGKNWKDF